MRGCNEETVRCCLSGAKALGALDLVGLVKGREGLLVCPRFLNMLQDRKKKKEKAFSFTNPWGGQSHYHKI